MVSAQQTKPTFKYEDPMGVVKIKPGEPVHIACWFVVAGPDASLGTDTKRGVEIAIVTPRAAWRLPPNLLPTRRL
jgi:branched-chain amino acid transport system substrate-binding protein